MNLNLNLHSLQFLAAIILGATLLALQAAQTYYDTHPPPHTPPLSSGSAREWWREADDRNGTRVLLLGYLQNVDYSARTFDFRWVAGTANVAQHPSITVHFEQTSYYKPTPSPGPHRAHLPLAALAHPHPHPGEQVVTHHILDGAWARWAHSDDPARFPFDRYTFSATLRAVDSDFFPFPSPSSPGSSLSQSGSGAVGVTGIGLGDASKARSYPAIALWVYPAFPGTDPETGFKETVGFFVERTVLEKIRALLGCAGAWVLVLSALGGALAELGLGLNIAGNTGAGAGEGKGAGVGTRYRMLATPLVMMAVLPRVRQLACAGERGGPEYGVVMDYGGLFPQEALLALLVVGTGVVLWRRAVRDGVGAIALGTQDGE